MEGNEKELKQAISELKKRLDEVSKKLSDEQQNSQLLEHVIATIPGNVYWMNERGIFQGCNDNQLRKLGLTSRGEFIGKTYEELLEPEDAARVRKINTEVVSSGKSLTLEELGLDDDGKEAIYLTTKVPLCNNNHEIVGLVGMSVDITARKNMEQDLQAAKEQAEIANKVKTYFIRNMQHDIRTPLSGLWGMADILERQIDKTEHKTFINNIKLCSNELLSYCDSILDFSNIEENHPAILAKKFNITDLVSKVLILERPAAIAKNLFLTVAISKNLPSILIGDDFRIYRILVNIVSNAIKFTNSGGIEIRLDKIISKDNADRKLILKIQVIDTGIGMPRDKQDYVFEKFSRLNPSNQGKYKGLGLGLKIVKEFMNDLEGDIEIISEPEVGTNFVCMIPFKLPLVDKLVGVRKNE